jgi:hypothetical protein
MFGDAGRQCAEIILRWAGSLFDVALDALNIRVVLQVTGSADRSRASRRGDAGSGYGGQSIRLNVKETTAYRGFCVLLPGLLPRFCLQNRRNFVGLRMTQVDAEHRKTSFRRETGGYVPRQFNPVTRERFLRDRRQKHLSRCSGKPTDAQIAMVQSLAILEWGALSAERQDTLISMREAREFRRLHLRVVADFERSLRPSQTLATDALGYAKSLGIGNNDTRRGKHRTSGL